jgi:large subunit ribosomal protein L25
MKEVSIVANPRAKVGKGSARQTRMAGHIPAVVYGPEIDPVPISIDAKAFRAAVRGSTGASTIFDLDVDGKKNKVVIRDIQRDPITSNVTHIDFHAISMNKPIHLSIPIRFVGVSEGVKNQGGIMQTTMRELEISCLPADIPEKVEIDVAKLNIGDSVHVEDLSIPNVNIISDEHSTVVVISAPTVLKSTAEEAAEAEAAEEAAEGEAPAEEGEGEEKKEEAAEKKEGEKK